MDPDGVPFPTESHEMWTKCDFLISMCVDNEPNLLKNKRKSELKNLLLPEEDGNGFREIHRLVGD